MTLPTTPTKRGHIFKGWHAEHFDRGTFANWSAVPTSAASYSQDYFGNRTPVYNDFIVVTDATGYTPQMTSFITVSKQASNHAIIINNTTVGTSNATRTYTVDGVKYTVTNSAGGSSIVLTADKNVKYDKKIIPAGSAIISTKHGASIGAANLYYSKLNNLDGTWKFVYHGDWEIDGQSGWESAEQIVSE